MAADPIEVVGAGIRTARIAETAPDFWREHARRTAWNHETLYLAAYAVLAALDRGVPPSSGMVERLRAALNDREDINAALTAHLRGRLA